MTTHTIEINMDVKCKRCRKKGAGPGGYCLGCVVKNLYEGKYDHILNPALGKERAKRK